MLSFLWVNTEMVHLSMKLTESHVKPKPIKICPMSYALTKKFKNEEGVAQPLEMSNHSQGSKPLIYIYIWPLRGDRTTPECHGGGLATPKRAVGGG
jgi:hypothetical protein